MVTNWPRTRRHAICGFTLVKNCNCRAKQIADRDTPQQHSAHRKPRQPRPQCVVFRWCWALVDGCIPPSRAGAHQHPRAGCAFRSATQAGHAQQWNTPECSRVDHPRCSAPSSPNSCILRYKVLRAMPSRPAACLIFPWHALRASATVRFSTSRRRPVDGGATT